MSDANVQPLIAKHLAPWLCLGEASVTDDERWRDLKGKKQNERDRGGEWGKSGRERWSSTRADNNRSVLYKDKKQETEEDREPSFSESKSQVAPVSSNCGDEAEGSETLSTLLWKKLREGNVMRPQHRLQTLFGDFSDCGDADRGTITPSSRPHPLI